MHAGTLRPGEVVAALGGLVLLAATVMDWYGVTSRAEAGSEAGLVSDGLNAWQSFDVLDVLLAVLALGALAVLLLNLTRRSPSVPVAAEVLTLALALVTTLAVAYRLLDQPGPNDSVGVEPGAYVGALATLAVLFGTLRALQDESPRAAPAPEVELRRAPPAVPGRAFAHDAAAAPDTDPPRPDPRH